MTYIPNRHVEWSMASRNFSVHSGNTSLRFVPAGITAAIGFAYFYPFQSIYTAEQ